MYSRSTITEQKLTPSAKRAQTQTELNELPLCSLYGKGTSTKARNDLVNRPQSYTNPNQQLRETFGNKFRSSVVHRRIRQM